MHTRLVISDEYIIEKGEMAPTCRLSEVMSDRAYFSNI